MGKVSDALDRIDSLGEIGKVDSLPLKEQAEDSISPKTESILPIEKYGNKFDVNGKWDDRLFKAVHNNSKMADVFTSLSSTILDPPDGKKVPKSIMVSSATVNEGKSFITANLGVSFAKRFDQPCVLVDCDFYHPTLAHNFGLNSKNGLVDFLKDQVDLSGLTIETSVPKLYILPSGIVSDKSPNLLSSPRMNKIVEEISRRYNDYTIIYDSPPILSENEFFALAGQVEAIILVVRQRYSKKAEVQRFINAVGEKRVLGIVFNDLLSLS